MSRVCTIFFGATTKHMVFYDTISRGSHVTRKRLLVRGLPYSSRNVLGMNVGAGFFSNLKNRMSRAFNTVKNFVTNNLGQIKSVLKNAPEVLGKVADGAAFAAKAIGKTDNKILNGIKTAAEFVGKHGTTAKNIAKKVNDSKLTQVAINAAQLHKDGKEIKVAPIIQTIANEFGKMAAPKPSVQSGNSDKPAAAAAAAKPPAKEGGRVRSKKSTNALLQLIEQYKK